MKKTRLILAGVLIGMAGIDAFGEEVGTAAVKILPERSVNVRQLSYWSASTAVEQGALMRWGNNAYWASAGGITGEDAPTFRSGTETNGTVILRYIAPGARRGFVIQLHDAGPVWVKAYSAPGEDDGIMLSGSLAHWSERGDGCPQGAIWVVSTAGSNTVTSMEW